MVDATNEASRIFPNRAAKNKLLFGARRFCEMSATGKFGPAQNALELSLQKWKMRGWFFGNLNLCLSPGRVARGSFD
jgi:hypothetical protein